MKIDDETRRKVLVTPEDLNVMMKGERAPHIIAVQSINPYTGADSHGDGFIPGAVEAEAYADFQAPARADLGNRPLPDIADLEVAARRWGLTAEDHTRSAAEGQGPAQDLAEDPHSPIWIVVTCELERTLLWSSSAHRDPWVRPDPWKASRKRSASFTASKSIGTRRRGST